MSADTGTGEDGTRSRPVLRVVRGDASAEEVAALVTVLGALGAGTPGHDPSAEGTSAWTDRRAAVRRELPHGPGAWRASSWPR